MPSIRFYRNLALVIWLIATATFVASLFKMIDLYYLLVINISATITEMILVVIVIRKVLKNRKLPNMISSKVSSKIFSKILISKGKVSDRYIKGNNNVFDRYIVPTNPMKESIFRIGIELAERFIGPSLELSVIRMCEAGTCEQKIDASDCSPKGTHSLQIYVDPREKVNFRFNKDIKIKSIAVDELYIP